MPTRLIEQTSEDTHMYRVWNFLTNYSLLLIFGAIIALIWANIDYKSYHDFVQALGRARRSPEQHALGRVGLT